MTHAQDTRVDDAVLVARAKTGDGAAFEELFCRYRDRVFAVVLGYVRDRDEALDLTQDAFLKAYRKLVSFDGRCGFYTWVTQIAIHRAIDWCRKRKRRKTIRLGDYREDTDVRLQQPDGSVTPPGQALEASELREHFERALATLSDKHRTVFVLHTVEDMPYKDVAATLEVSIGTVMSRLHYARKKLQVELAELLELDADEEKR